MFQRTRFGTFLLLLAQLQLRSKGWSTDIYFQTNQSTQAIKDHTKVEFEKKKFI